MQPAKASIGAAHGQVFCLCLQLWTTLSDARVVMLSLKAYRQVRRFEFCLSLVDYGLIVTQIRQSAAGPQLLLPTPAGRLLLLQLRQQDRPLLLRPLNMPRRRVLLRWAAAVCS